MDAPRAPGGGRAARRGGIGGVGVRGPGETQLEVDRREIRARIAQLISRLEDVRAHRAQHRASAQRSAIPVVAIVGYTNAGKCTLLNALAGAEVLAENKLFATLDPTTRRVALPGNQEALFTDTVGFIQKLPTTLVAAFRATLEEIIEADLLLEVVDITHENAVEQSQTRRRRAGRAGAAEKPRVTALNKIDLLADPASVDSAIYPNAVAVSAVTGAGLGGAAGKDWRGPDRGYALPVRSRALLTRRPAGAMAAAWPRLGRTRPRRGRASRGWRTRGGGAPRAISPPRRATQTLALRKPL